MAKEKKAVRKTKKAVRKSPKAEEKKAKPKRKRVWISNVVAEADLSSKAKSLIKKADDLELQIADAKDELTATLIKIQDELGSPSFEHPERGAMTIMRRNDKVFWRAKPIGKAAA